MHTLTTLAGHRAWLPVTAIVVGGFGPVFALGSMLVSAEPARFSLDPLAWPLDGALTGGFLFGWGVMIWALRRWLFDLAPEAVRRTVLTGLIAWFLLDSAGSVGAGAASNVVFNVLVLLTCVGPMWVPARD